MASEAQFLKSAKKLNVDPAVVKAIAEVESCGEGFLADGRPKILFEPHIFWKELRKRRIDPGKLVKGNEDILYPIWKSGSYGPVSKQHDRLNRAIRIHRESALHSASWGKFQIMGFNYAQCDLSSVENFVTEMGKTEDEHLHLFTCYIKNSLLDDELRALDWKGFARAYNGPSYWKNSYDRKLSAAYIRFKNN